MIHSVLAEMDPTNLDEEKLKGIYDTMIDFTSKITSKIYEDNITEASDQNQISSK
jgi:hypothetical protein